MVDSGVALSVCPPSWAPDIKLLPLPQKRNLQAATARRFRRAASRTSTSSLTRKASFLPPAWAR
eukprot:10017292-Alexandrium_andersonii.AAC.1